MSTPITVPYLVRLLYTVSGHTSKLELFCPGLSGVDSDSFDTIALTAGAQAGTTLTAALTETWHRVGGIMSQQAQFTVAELYSVAAGIAPSTVAFTPLASKSFAIAGTGGGGSFLSSQVSFTMRKGKTRGRFQMMNCNQNPPFRFPAPAYGGSGPFDAIFGLYNTYQYWSLRDGRFPDTAFGVSVQYNTRLMRSYGIRP